MSLGNKLSKSVKSISKASSDVMEVGKLKLSIRKREDELYEKYLQIGEYVYNRLKNLSMVSKHELQQLINEIQGIEEEIITLEKLILNIRNISFCESCKVQLEDEIKYCPLCGQHIKM